MRWSTTTSRRVPDRRHARGLVDTSVVIELERLPEDVLPTEIAVSAITFAELAAGPHATADAAERARRQDRVQRAEATFEPIPFDASTARPYGRVYAAIVSGGRKARGRREVDLLIAAPAVAGAVPLFTISTTTSTPEAAAATSELNAICLVVAVGFLGPIVARAAARVVGPPLAALSPVGGFLACANLGAATRRFASASTPLVLTVAMSCTLLFSTTTTDHAVSSQRHAGLTGQLAVMSAGPGLARVSARRRARHARGGSAVALTPTTLGPSLGASDDTIPAQILSGGQGGGLDVDMTAGSLAALHGDAIAVGRRRTDAAHAHIGDRVAITLGDGARTHATVVAIYTRELAFGDALLAPDLAAGHQTTPLLGTILIQTSHPTAVARRLETLAARYPGLRVSDRASLTTASDADREMNRWLGPLFVAMIFAFTSIAVLNTLVMIALRRGRELALLRLVGATTRQVRSMARWEALLIIVIGLGVGLAIAATALLPLNRALTGNLRPSVPARPLAAILGSRRCWP
jgi:putative ABC transport system permease protein